MLYNMKENFITFFAYVLFVQIMEAMEPVLAWHSRKMGSESSMC